MPRLQLCQLTKRFGNKGAVSEVELRVETRQRLVIVGPSGCGKTSLLRMIAGLDTPSSGDIKFDDVTVTAQAPRQRDLGMVFQGENLLPQLTVRQNLGFGLKLRHCRRDKIGQRVVETAELLKLCHLLDNLPSDLSGGERQLVAVGRLLVSRPRLWLLDEPLAHVDPHQRRELCSTICRLHKASGATAIYVTHDQDEAMAVGDQIGILDQGRLQQIGTPQDVYERPANRFVASFIGGPPMNFVSAENHPPHLHILGNQVLTELPTAGKLTCGFRAEAVQLKGELAVQFSGTVVDTAYLGHESIVAVRVGDQQLAVRLVGHEHGDTYRRLKRGENLKLGVAAADLHAFDLAGNRLGRCVVSDTD